MIEYVLKVKTASFVSEQTQRNYERLMLEQISELAWVNSVELFKFKEGIEHTNPLFKRNSKAKTYDEEQNEGVEK